MNDCIFCKITRGDIPTKFVYEDEHVVAFPDLHPKMPVHMLIVPRLHIATMNDFPNEPALAQSMMHAVQQVARDCKIDANGYRTIINTNADGGQEVYHLHWHVLGGRAVGRMVST